MLFSRAAKSALAAFAAQVIHKICVHHRHDDKLPNPGIFCVIGVGAEVAMVLRQSKINDLDLHWRPPSNAAGYIAALRRYQVHFRMFVIVSLHFVFHQRGEHRAVPHVVPIDDRVVVGKILRVLFFPVRFCRGDIFRKTGIGIGAFLKRFGSLKDNMAPPVTQQFYNDQ